MNKNLTRAAMTFLVVLVLIWAAGKAISTSLFGGRGASGSKPSGVYGETVALIHIEGVISGDRAFGGPFAAAAASSVELCDQLYKIKDDGNIAAVVLRINSPGGSAAASDEIYQAVKAVSSAGKPVVVSMGDVAASGGYYIAAAADHIIANPATLTGSIGVVFELLNWDEAAAKLGIESEALHAGEFKDIGSPWRDMTGRERELLQGMLTQVHNQFIRAVDEGRENLDEPAVRKLATGMIYNGEDAAASGLVDSLGGLQDAKVKARELAKLPEDALVEEYGIGSIWDEIFGASASSSLGTDSVIRSAAESYAAQGLMQRAAKADGLSTLARGLFLNTALRDLVVR